MKKSILLIITIIICTLSVKAQKGDYVINNHGDTIKCELKVPVIGTPKYKPVNASNEKFFKITLDGTQEYYDSKRHANFRRIYIDSVGMGHHTIEFLKVIERGKISLYLWEYSYSGYPGRNSTPATTEQYVVITKNSDTGRMLKTSSMALINRTKKKMKDMLANLIKDNNMAYNKYINGSQTELFDIQNIVHLYNTGQELPRKSEEEYLGN